MSSPVKEVNGFYGHREDRRQSLAPTPINFNNAKRASGNFAETRPVFSENGDRRPSRAERLRRFDWLQMPPPENLSPFKKFIHDVDWSKSNLGPISGWPEWLKRMAMLVISDPSPAVVYVDNEDGITDAIVYNEAYPALVGNKHPSLQGGDPRIGFAEIWSTFELILARGRENFETVVGDAQPLLLFRHSFLEETWFSWKFSPIVGPEGYVVGSHATVVENTREVILDRRSMTLQTIDQQVTSSTTTEDLWQCLATAMETNGADIPFALIYAADVNMSILPERERSPAPPPSSLTLAASVGEGAFTAAPNKLELNDDTGFASYFRDAMVQNQAIRVSVDELPESLVAVFRSREHGESCKNGIICPIQSPASRSALGFVFLAQNPRRPYDDDYADFIDRLMKQTSATANRLLLSEQLSRRTKEFKESEVKFTRFTSRAPLALALFETNGHLMYGNDFWYRIFQYPRQADDDVSASGTPLWMNLIHVDDRDHVWDAWSRVLESKEPVRVQFRVTTSRMTLDGQAPDGNITILCQAFADLDDDGNVQSVMSCLTDVSELKDLEEQLRARTHEVEAKMEHVLEMKRQQENFIDMTSHEIRNPLSAVLHLAEEIFNTSSEVLEMPFLNSLPEIKQEDIKAAMRGSIEAAETITACVLHQKRIVDDILVLSRLDSELLQVTPVATQPQDLITSSLKMFEAEVRTANMSLDFVKDQSLEDLKIEWLMFDPNRVIQILVNLVGNAIKFTKSQDVRHITVCMKASLKRPSEDPFDIEFVPLNKDKVHMGKGCNGQGHGEIVYLSLSVSDTGQGLSSDEKKVLFQRFSQGSKRTHTKYGGSGLGLWISKQLTELHGGQIGLSSKESHGSNFTFFIKTRRTAPPEENLRKMSVSEETNRASGEILSHAAAKDINQMKPEERPLAMRHRSSNEVVRRLKDGNGQKRDEEELVVLVVEDNLVNQRIIAKQLRKQGCVVHVANHGEEALKFLESTVFWAGNDTTTSSDLNTLTKSNSYTRSKSTTTSNSNTNSSPDSHAITEEPIKLSIILMDLEMPVMDGLTAVRQIRSMEANGQLKMHIPVLAVTANARGEQLDEALKAGMDESITKPYRVPDIMAKIRRLGFLHG